MTGSMTELDGCRVSEEAPANSGLGGSPPGVDHFTKQRLNKLKGLVDGQYRKLYGHSTIQKMVWVVSCIESVMGSWL